MTKGNAWVNIIEIEQGLIDVDDVSFGVY